MKESGKWMAYNQADLGRNYQLFEKMAGVRGDEGKAISCPRGLPADISEIVQIEDELWGSDGHSHSWLSAEEANILEDWMRDHSLARHMAPFGYIAGNGFSRAEINDSPYADARLVFWFDN